tara:strand:- start:786 stop:1871 length:1086 start_codon:yes stop_codon:yes gene_type:complete
MATGSCDGEQAAITVLLCVPDKVRNRLGALLDAPVQGVRFVPYVEEAGEDEEGRHATTPPPLPACDLVLHKAVNDIVLRLDDAAAARRYATLERLAARVPLLDPLPSVALFADRGVLCRTLAGLRPEVPQPRFLELREPSESVAAAARAAGMRFPLLCKPLVACGPAASHELAVALCEEGLSQVRPPVLLQEYVAHHGAVMYKGYCVGRRVHVAQRASLPDLRLAGHDGAATTLVRFDSQKPPPSASAFGVGTAADAAPVTDGMGPAAASVEEERRRACTEQIASRVGEQLGVELLGVDVVFAEPSGELLVVDANYFPHGPHSFPDFAQALCEVVRRRTQSPDGSGQPCTGVGSVPVRAQP